MKRIFCLIIVLVMFISLVACGEEQISSVDSSNETQNNTQSDEESAMRKIRVKISKKIKVQKKNYVST